MGYDQKHLTSFSLLGIVCTRNIPLAFSEPLMFEFLKKDSGMFQKVSIKTHMIVEGTALLPYGYFQRFLKFQTIFFTENYVESTTITELINLPFYDIFECLSAL